MKKLLLLICFALFQMVFLESSLSAAYTYIDRFGQFTNYTDDEQSNTETSVTLSLSDGISALASANTTTSDAYSTFEEYIAEIFNGATSISLTQDSIIDIADIYQISDASMPTDFFDNYYDTDIYTNIDGNIDHIIPGNYIVLDFEADISTSNGNAEVGDGEIFNVEVQVFNIFYWYEDDIFLQFGLVDGTTLADYEVSLLETTGISITLNDFNLPFRYISGDTEFCGEYLFDNYSATNKTIDADTYDCTDNSIFINAIQLDLTTGKFTITE